MSPRLTGPPSPMLLTEWIPSAWRRKASFRPQRLAGGAVVKLDVDAGVVLRETGHFTSARDRHPEFGDPAGQDALDVVLPQPEPVVEPGGRRAPGWRAAQ